MSIPNYHPYIPPLSEKILGFYELLKADTQVKVTEELLNNYKAINTALAEACGLTLKLPITGRQYGLMTDASFRASGYALMVEEDNEKKLMSKIFAVRRIWIKSVLPSAIRNVQLNPKERVELKLRDDITFRPIQVNLQSTDVTGEEELFFLTEETIQSEEEILLQKEQTKQKARDEELRKIKLTITETAPTPIKKALYTFGATKKDARIRVQQNLDLVVQAIKRKLICEEYDKHLLQTDPKAKRLLVHENRLIVKDGNLMAK